jgi:hypothetical protein
VDEKSKQYKFTTPIFLIVFPLSPYVLPICTGIGRHRFGASCARHPNSRYEGGVATYLDVITAQHSLLNSELQAAQLTGQHMLTLVFLIKALGGDWPDAQVAQK